MDGLPPGLTEGLPEESGGGCASGAAARRAQLRNSMIDAGIHIPVLAAFLYCLLQPAEGHSDRPPRMASDMAEAALRQCIQGSLWETGRLRAFPGMRLASDVVACMQA